MEEGVLLSQLSTFGIGGPARYYAQASTVEEMATLLSYGRQHHLPIHILGKGSNSLFDDLGFDGLVIHNKIDFCTDEGEGRFHVGAGYSFALLGVRTARQGWCGLEFASGIPASVGGAVFMNAGANGAETADVLTAVDWMDEDGILHTLPREKLQFSYRRSPFHERGGVITGAHFALIPSDDARARQHEIVAYRTKTQPYGEPSAGCIFRNPDGGHAGKLIEEAGLKGEKLGGAEVSPLHANFIVNSDKASHKDVLALIEQVQQRVYAHSGIRLQPEVRVIPYRPKEM